MSDLDKKYIAWDMQHWREGIHLKALRVAGEKVVNHALVVVAILPLLALLLTHRNGRCDYL